VPLLIARGAAALPVFALVFAVMTAFWLGIGFGLVAHPAARPLIDRYGRKVVPFTLIGIGVYILTR
jgi:cadmium resistance protein CadD (predicted permease)